MLDTQLSPTAQDELIDLVVTTVSPLLSDSPWSEYATQRTAFLDLLRLNAKSGVVPRTVRDMTSFLDDQSVPLASHGIAWETFPVCGGHSFWLFTKTM
jgi:hypothetical protein